MQQPRVSLKTRLAQALEGAVLEVPQADLRGQEPRPRVAQGRAHGAQDVAFGWGDYARPIGKKTYMVLGADEETRDPVWHDAYRDGVVKARKVLRQKERESDAAARQGSASLRSMSDAAAVADRGSFAAHRLRHKRQDALWTAVGRKKKKK